MTRRRYFLNNLIDFLLFLRGAACSTTAWFWNARRDLPRQSRSSWSSATATQLGTQLRKKKTKCDFPNKEKNIYLNLTGTIPRWRRFGWASVLRSLRILRSMSKRTTFPSNVKGFVITIFLNFQQHRWHHWRGDRPRPNARAHRGSHAKQWEI